MRIYRRIADIADIHKGAVVAVGNFDGVHRGHVALLRTAQWLAEERAAPFAVMSFEPPPQEFFHPGAPPFRLTPFPVKTRLLRELGADALYALPFDDALAHQSAENFVTDTLIGDLAAGAAVVGGDFRFGAGRAGDAAMLAYMGEMEGLGVEIVPPVMAGDEKISSTSIRRALAAGKAEEAAILMGRPFAIEGLIEHGEARGRTLGFPTVNLSLEGYIHPAFGIYAVRVMLYDNGQPVSRHEGVANIGIRPMYRTEKPLLEAFLFDFDRDVYGRYAAVELISYLRPEAKFSNVDKLIQQMAADSENARQVLDRIPARC
jgi:riboflavin kinase / FMN adenylyltransferase